MRLQTIFCSNVHDLILGIMSMPLLYILYDVVRCCSQGIIKENSILIRTVEKVGESIHASRYIYVSIFIFFADARSKSISGGHCACVKTPIDPHSSMYYLRKEEGIVSLHLEFRSQDTQVNMVMEFQNHTF